MTPEIDKLIEMALSDGIVTEKEREILFRKAEKLGLDFDEFELYLENRIASLEKQAVTPLSTLPEDGYDITNQELLIRTQRWVNLTTEENYFGKIEAFPQQRRMEATLLDTGKELGKNILGAVGTSFKSKVSFANPLNYVRLVNQLTGDGTTEKKLNHQEIVELATNYLTLMEMRCNSDSYLKVKFDELSKQFRINTETFHQKKNSGWLKKLF